MSSTIACFFSLVTPSLVIFTLTNGMAIRIELLACEFEFYFSQSQRISSRIFSSK